MPVACTQQFRLLGNAVSKMIRKTILLPIHVMSFVPLLDPFFECDTCWVSWLVRLWSSFGLEAIS